MGLHYFHHIKISQTEFQQQGIKDLYLLKPSKNNKNNVYLIIIIYYLYLLYSKKRTNTDIDGSV